MLDDARKDFLAARDAQAQEAQSLHFLYNDLRTTLSDLQKAREALAAAAAARESDVRRNLEELAASRCVLAEASEALSAPAKGFGGFLRDKAVEIAAALLILVVVGFFGLAVLGRLELLRERLDQGSKAGVTTSAPDSAPAGGGQ
jgi:hypothetical protein